MEELPHIQAASKGRVNIRSGHTTFHCQKKTVGCKVSYRDFGESICRAADIPHEHEKTVKHKLKKVVEDAIRLRPR